LPASHAPGETRRRGATRCRTFAAISKPTVILMPRSTKVVATLGPASSEKSVLERMIGAGVDVVRFNFSHGTAEDHLGRAKLVREAALACGREVAIMADLQGPKIRVGKFAEGKVLLVPGARFVLDTSSELGTK